MDTYFNLDTIIQGLVVVVSLIIGCLIFFTDHFEKTEDNKEDLSQLNVDIGNTFLDVINIILGIRKGGVLSGVKKSEEIKEDKKGVKNLSGPEEKNPKAEQKNTETVVRIARSISYVILFSLLTFVAGIFAETGADVWMNNGNQYHLGNKAGWVAKGHEIKNVSKSIRLKKFNQIFKYHKAGTDKELSDYYKTQFYYYAKNKLMFRKEYADYINESASVIGYSQVFSAAFFIIYLFSWMNLVSIQFRLIVGRLSRDKTSIVTDLKKGLRFHEKGYNIKNSIITGIYGSIMIVIIVFLGVYAIGVLDQAPDTAEVLNKAKIECLGKTNFACIEKANIAIIEKAKADSAVAEREYTLRMTCFYLLNTVPFLMWAFMWFWAKVKGKDNRSQGESKLTNYGFFLKHYYSIIFLYVGLFGYLIAGATWAEAEDDKHAKVYGIYKTEFEEFEEEHNKMFMELFGIEKKDE